MSSTDLFFIIATLSLVFVTAFLCSLLYWLTRSARLWYTMTENAKVSINQCIDRFHDALHAVTSLKTIAEIGVETLHAATAVYRGAKGKTRKKKSEHPQSE